MRFITLFITLFISLQTIANDNPLWMRYPAISPDGQSIVFSYQGDLFTVPSSGGEAKHLTVHEAYDYRPVWSPDGSSIAFASNRYGNFDVFLIPAKGGEAKRLTTYSSGEYPNCFTPDGSSVLLQSPRVVGFPQARVAFPKLKWELIFLLGEFCKFFTFTYIESIY